MNCFGRSSKIKEDNDKIDASVSRTALSTAQHFRRRIFCGKTFGFRASVACQQTSETISDSAECSTGLSERFESSAA